MPKLPAPPDTLSPTAQLVSAAQQQGPKLGVKDVLFILDYFYAIHYRFGMELEQAMSLGHLSRIQAAVIWIVQFRVDAAGWVKRKEVELALKSWFECSGARASKLLYELSSPPLSLIRQVPNPDSRREKIISLTPCGTRFFWDMQKAGKMFFANYFESMSPRELKQGIRFFGLAFDPHSPEVAAATRLASLPVNGVQGLNNSCKGKENQDINEVIRSKHRSETLDKALTFFYPIHYQVGLEVETLMSQGKLSRQETAIIWLIASEADNEGWVRRQRIERALSCWFDSSNSRVSQMLRRLAGLPIELIVQVENPASGREKLIRLSDAGDVFLKSMRRVGIDYFSTYLSHLSPHELERGAFFFKQAFGAVNEQSLVS